jgi:hypothetical protein
MDGKQLPKIGDVFVFPLDKKIFSFCWVVRGLKPRSGYVSKLKKFILVQDMVIACATWVGDGDPSPQDIAKRKVLRDSEWGTKAPCLRIASHSPPRGFRKIARVKKAGISAKTIENYSGFQGLQRDARRQWYRDHDRRKLFEEDRAEEAEAAEETAEWDAEDARIAAKVKKRKRATAATIGRIELLPDWEGLVSRRHRVSMEKLLRDLVKRLRAAKDRKTKLDAIAAIVESMNAWNDRTNVIETPEREALATAIDDIGHVFGVRGHDLAGDHRDW